MKVADGQMMNRYENTASEVPTLDASFVTRLICAEAEAGHLEKMLVMKVGVSDHTVAHRLGAKIAVETEVSCVLLM